MILHNYINEFLIFSKHISSLKLTKSRYKYTKNTLWNKPKSALNVDSIEHKSVSEQVRNSFGNINVLRTVVNDERL